MHAIAAAEERAFRPSRPALFSGAGLRALGAAWLCATLFSGLPSTLHALWSGGDVMEATWAAGRMLLPAAEPGGALLAAAALAHGMVSLFWALALWRLPRRRLAMEAVAAAAAIAVLDLLIIAPRFFPAVAALPFWPQFADHLMWGACYGLALGRARRPA